MKRVTQRLIELRAAPLTVLTVCAFIGKPYLTKADARIRVYMLPKGVNDEISGFPVLFKPVNTLQAAAIPHKMRNGIAESGNIIGMHILECITIHGRVDC